MSVFVGFYLRKLYAPGLTLVFKRINTIIAISSFAIMGLIALPALPLNWASFLPLASGTTLARITVLSHQPILIMNFLIVFINSAVYLSIGLYVYKYFESIAKQRNLIGQY